MDFNDGKVTKKNWEEVAESSFSINDDETKPILQKSDESSAPLRYCVEDTPPWGFCMAQGLQHFLATVSSSLAISLILQRLICATDQPIIMCEVLSNTCFVSGITTILQNAVGVRLPIVQASSASVLVVITSLMSLPAWKCQDSTAIHNINNGTLNSTNSTHQRYNQPIVDYQARFREISGNLMVVSMIQVFIGFSGITGFLLRYIGPIAISPTVMLIGLSLFKMSADSCGVNWLIAILTIALIYIFSQVIQEWNTPIFGYSKSKGFHISWIKGFKMFSVILAIVVVWILCIILTYAGAFTDDKNARGYRARVDAKLNVLQEAHWIYIPQPFKYGMPTISFSGTFGLAIVALLGTLECLGDFFSISTICNEQRPSSAAVNRGIGVTGIGMFLSGLFYSCSGVTSYSENVATVGLTKVASRRVIYCAAILSLICSVLGKLGAFFTILPEPILGGSSLVLFGIIFSVGVSVLQPVDLASQRNLTILGTSLISGFAVPYWFEANPSAVNTGIKELDDIIRMILGTGIAVCCILALTLDNLIPGTLEERGMKRKHADDSVSSNSLNDSHPLYDLPKPIQKIINRYPWMGNVPFLTYRGLKRNNNYGAINIDI